MKKELFCLFKIMVVFNCITSLASSKSRLVVHNNKHIQANNKLPDSNKISINKISFYGNNKSKKNVTFLLFSEKHNETILNQKTIIIDDSVLIEASYRKLKIRLNKKLSKQFLVGANIYFGMVTNLKNYYNKAMNDNQFILLLNKQNRGLAALLLDGKIEEEFESNQSNKKIAYCVIQKGHLQYLYYYWY